MHSVRIHILRMCMYFGSILAAVVGAQGIANAAPTPDPTVVVVRDVTPIGCHENIRRLVGSTYVLEKSFPCPAGTSMGIIHVPLSEAIAKHESYVMLPSPSASQAEQDQVQLQIQKLSAAADARVHPAPTLSTSPMTSCTPETYTVQIDGGSLWWDTNTTYDMWVDYDTHSDCTVYIWLSELHAVNINSYFYWDRDKYAAFTGFVGCRQVTNGYPYWNPDTTHNSGYYYEQFVYSGSNCTNFDNSQYYDVGPLHD